MKPGSRLNNKTLDPKSHNQDHTKSEFRPIRLLAFLEAENVRLRSTVVELSLDTMALREMLNTNQGPRSDRGC